MFPETEVTVGACRVHVLGTVPGFGPDAARVESAFAREPQKVALGVPPEDIEALEALHDDPSLGEALPEADDWTARFLELASAFGPTRIPSPDLEAAYREARRRGIPVVALDLDDAAHTDAHTRRLGLRHVIRMNRQRNKLLAATFAAPDVYDLARQWDAAENAGRLADIQRERAAWMARRVGEEATVEHLLCIVPAARFEQVVAALREAPRRT